MMSKESKVILSALLSSSSSSETDEENLAEILRTSFNANKTRRSNRKSRGRQIVWNRSIERRPYQPIIQVPKSKRHIEILNFWKEFNDIDFRFHLRISKSTFDQLLAKYIEYSSQKDDQVDKGLKEKQLICFLSFASKPITVQEIADSFSSSPHKITYYITSVMDFLLDLGNSLLKLPESNEIKEQIAQDFLNIAGLPNVIGCIDRVAINVTPRVIPYSNKIDSVPIVMQAICDNKRRFLCIAKDINDTKLLNYCGEEYCLLGGETFQLRQWLITKYGSGHDCDDVEEENLNTYQKIFNHKFDETHCLIGSAFALLKDRFQQLTKFCRLKQLQMTMAFIVSLCVVHNFAIDCNDFWDEVKPEVFLSDEHKNITNRIKFRCEKGLMKRNAMMNESCFELIEEMDDVEQIIIDDAFIFTEDSDAIVDIVYVDYSDE